MGKVVVRLTEDYGSRWGINHTRRPGSESLSLLPQRLLGGYFAFNAIIIPSSAG